MKYLLELFYNCVRPGLKIQSKKGFTLIELMVVICCVAILAAAASPSFFDYLRDSGLKQAVYQLSGDLYRAKSQAIRTQTVQNVNLNLAANTYFRTNPNSAINLTDYWGAPTFTGNPGDGTPDVFSPTIAFNARGLSTATSQAYLTGNGRTFRVQVSVAGAVSIHEWSGGAWIQ